MENSNKKIYLTRVGRELLKRKRDNVLRKLTRIFDDGERALLESYLAEIDHALENSRPIRKGNGNRKKVGLGCEVIVKNGKAKFTLTIVDAIEANPGQNKISYCSPVGKALMSKKRGEKVRANLPNGSSWYQILKIA